MLAQARKHSRGRHRGSLDVIADILEASHVRARKTYLMYRCNLSFKQLEHYLDFLLKKKLLRAVVEDGDRNPGLFEITDRGREFLKVYKGLKGLMK